MRETGLRNPWWIVFGSMFGLMVGNGAVMQFTFGVFIKPLTAEFASDRGTISAALTIGLVVTGLFTPLLGRLVDRYGIKRVVLPAIVLFAASGAALGVFVNSALAFVVIYAMMGLFATGQTPLPYAKAVSGAFDAHRGLALGVTMAGVGVGTVLLPLFAQFMVTNYGWRNAYLGLGAIVFLVAFPAVLFFVKEPAILRNDTRIRTAADGLTAREALKTGAFWMLAVTFFFVALACAGMLAHSVAILTDRGIPAGTAIRAISIGGAALIVGRLMSGWLLDRVYAPSVAAVFFAAPLAGIAVMLGSTSAEAGMAAVALVGLGLGAEVDMIAFLICRYLGMRSFGEIYGYLFLGFMLGSGLGPFVMGLCFAKTGSYQIAMIGLGVGLLIAIGLMLRMGAYRFGAHAMGGVPIVEDATVPA